MVLQSSAWCLSIQKYFAWTSLFAVLIQAMIIQWKQTRTSLDTKRALWRAHFFERLAWPSSSVAWSSLLGRASSVAETSSQTRLSPPLIDCWGRTGAANLDARAQEKTNDVKGYSWSCHEHLFLMFASALISRMQEKEWLPACLAREWREWRAR